MTAKTRHRLDTLHRNDPDEAFRVAETIAEEEGGLPARTAYYLIMLQDDATALVERLRTLPLAPVGNDGAKAL